MRSILVTIAAVLCLSAGPSSSPSADLVRAANDAVGRGDWEAANQLYELASERAHDPGLVAYNHAMVLFEQGDYRGAELLYLQSLSDAAISSDRRASAHYNRGVCLLHRGGDAKLYRAAIACFENALAIPDRSPGFIADARHNLEIAKLLWNEARAQESEPPKANDSAPERTSSADEPQKEPTDPSDSGDPTASQGDPMASQDPGGAKNDPTATTKQTPGAGTLPVLDDRTGVTPLSPSDTQVILDRVAERLRKDRRSNARLVAGPERPDVRDW